MKRIAYIVPALLASSPLAAQMQLPPAQNLDMLEAMVVGSLGAGIGQPGGPMAPLDRRMRLAACPTGLQIDPPTAGAVTVRCTTSGWRLRVPLTRSFNPVAATASMGGQPASLSNADIRKGDPIQLVAQGPSFSISVEATAMEDGRIGNRIRVAPSAKGAPIFAEVVDVGRVRLLGFK
jgi:flagella basal body P-ring formation protein FlgA